MIGFYFVVINIDDQKFGGSNVWKIADADSDFIQQSSLRIIT